MANPNPFPKNPSDCEHRVLYRVTDYVGGDVVSDDYACHDCGKELPGVLATVKGVE